MGNRSTGVIGAALLALSLAVSSAQAQTEPVEPTQPVHGERLLSVVGEGVVRGRPDMAIINAGVVSEARTAREALTANTEAMNRMLAALRESGIESRDLQTANFSVEPRYSNPPPDWDHSRPFMPEIIGYGVRNEVSVRVRDLQRIGDILDQVITLGANAISGPMFTAAQPGDLEDQARRAAMRDAIRKGALYAEAAGVQLGPISRISENVSQWPQPVPMAAMARESAQDASVPIEAGELTFRAQVSVTWDLP